MTLEEVEEFLRGDPSGVEISAAGIERAIRLPYKQMIPPEGIIIGTAVLHLVLRMSTIKIHLSVKKLFHCCSKRHGAGVG